MKKIKYNLTVRQNTGTEEAPVWADTAGPLCALPYSEENLALAEAEAFGEVAIEDDGQSELLESPTLEDRISAVEAAVLEMILGGEADG